MELTHTAARAGRLSSFLLEEMAMSTGLMNKLKWQEALLVNGIPRFTDHQVVPGDVIRVLLDEPRPEYPAEQGPLTILYEDDWLLAADKPAGMLIHPSRSQNSGTLANIVAGYYQATGQSCAFHPVTRLDRDTFGIVLLAKNAHSHQRLQALPLQKTYTALTFGGPREDSGIINAPIARRPLPSLLREIRPDGKEAITTFRVLERMEYICRLELTPVTGRTHQLRLHCAYSGFPILGDPQYGTAESQALSARLGYHYQQLRATTLEFSHPITGQPLMLHSRIPL